MKRQFLILIAIAAFTTGFTTNASGQAGRTLKANITFDFQIRDRMYPAGKYRIESARGHDNILKISSVSDASETEFILANHSNVGARETPRLVFRKYGEEYLLTKIVFGTDSGFSIRPSRRQRESEKDLALASPASFVIHLAK